MKETTMSVWTVQPGIILTFTPSDHQINWQSVEEGPRASHLFVSFVSWTRGEPARSSSIHLHSGLGFLFLSAFLQKSPISHPCFSFARCFCGGRLAEVQETWRQNLFLRIIGQEQRPVSTSLISDEERHWLHVFRRGYFRQQPAQRDDSMGQVELLSPAKTEAVLDTS